MAEAGNVSATKYLHTLMMERGRSGNRDDQWAIVMLRQSLQQNPEFGKMN